MIVNNVQFETTAVKPEQYPGGNLPEVAFVGRSNVGKSSFINTILNRKNLARVGGTPGKTRAVNFFKVEETLYLVDLPGYGYANVSKTEKASWGKTIDTYLSTRNLLVMVIMLVDIRHAPSSDDVIMHKWLADSGIPYLLAATKSDKIPRSKIVPQIREIRSRLNLPEQIKVIPFSSETKQGRDDIWNEIDMKLGIEKQV